MTPAVPHGHPGQLSMLFLFLCVCALVAVITPASISNAQHDCLMEICGFLNGDIYTRLVSRHLMYSYDESRLWHIQNLNVRLSVSNEECDTKKFLACLNEVLKKKLHIPLRKWWMQEMNDIQQRVREVADVLEGTRTGSLSEPTITPSTALDLEIRSMIDIIKMHVGEIGNDLEPEKHMSNLLPIYEWLKRALPGLNFRDQIAPVIAFPCNKLLYYIFPRIANPRRSNIVLDVYRGELWRHDDGRTILMEAIRIGDVDLARWIIQHAESEKLLEVGDDMRIRTIHYAAAAGNLDIVKMLVERGVKINIVDTSLRYPIHYAITMGHMEVVLCLVNARANINRPECGQSCLEVAQSVGNTEMMEYFRQLEQGRCPGGAG